MTQEQKTRLKEIGEIVDAIREHLPEYRYQRVYHDRQFLYDLLLQTIAERDEARQIAKEYRDSDGAESWYRDSTTDPLPWEAKDV